MKEINDKNRFWFWAKKTCLHYGGSREKNIVNGTNLRMFMSENGDDIIDIESDVGACSVRISGWNIGKCSICG